MKSVERLSKFAAQSQQLPEEQDDEELSCSVSELIIRLSSPDNFWAFLLLSLACMY